MKVLLYCVSFLISLVTYNLQAQDTTTYYGSSTKTHAIESSEGFEYRLKITTPPDYNANETYKTVYYLDAWWLEDVVKGAYGLLHLSKNTEPLILVGISLKADELQFNKQRSRDYTPLPYNSKFKFSIKLKEGTFVASKDNTGKADAFSLFLKQKVFPFVSKNYSVNNNEKSIIGHSFGGLFGINMLQKYPELFSNYIIISPALWWNNKALIKSEKLAHIANTKTPIKLFLCYGALENNTIARNAIALDSLITNIETNKLSYKFKAYSDQDHVSVLPQAIYDGLSFLSK